MIFQFHKGTIKTIKKSNTTFTSNIFQFHKGTIKTDKPLHCLIAFIIFQFHKGTIKTVGDDWVESDGNISIP